MNQFIEYYYRAFNFFAKKNIENKKINSWEAHCHLTIMLSTGILMWGYVILAYFTIESNIPWIVGIIASLIHNLSPLLLKSPGSIQLATNFLIGAGMLHQACFAYFSGGFMSPILIWFGILPMLGGITDGKRGIITWAALTATTAGFLLLLTYLGIEPPNKISSLGHMIGQAMMVFGWIFLSSLIILTFIFFKNQNETIILNGHKRIESLIQILCHDISNPLMNIKIRIDILAKIDSLKENKHIEKIKKSTTDLESILNHIKIWQSSSTGKMKVNVRPIIFSNLIPDIINQFESKLDNKNLKIVYNNLLPQDIEILADKEVLYGHVIANLISNAIKFSPKNSNIKINFSKNDEYGIIEILDYGIGIPKDLIPKLFNINEETNRNGTEGEPGTGFGLPIVKTFIESMNGIIHIESNETDRETWTKFTLKLPLATIDQ